MSPAPSDADRDHLLAVLREHYAQGRLSLDDLRARADVVLRARTLPEAAAALGDLPAALGEARAARPTRRRRYAESAVAPPGWVPTGERFRDPASGVVMRVWVDPADSSRHYVPDGASA